MAECKACKQDMLTADGCTVQFYSDFGDEKDYLRLRYEGGYGQERCGDCGCKVGQFHHPGCDVERCPKCHGQCISCDCPKATEKEPRNKLVDRFWEQLDPSIDGYSKAIEQLLSVLTDEQIKGLLPDEVDI